MSLLVDPMVRSMLEELMGVTIEEARDDFDSEYDEWYCVQIKPITCDCGRIMCYVEPDWCHRIVVWEQKDHPDLLNNCIEAKRLGFDPVVVQYHAYLGHCIPWDDVENAAQYG
jgi:hypothetical protein